MKPQSRVCLPHRRHVCVSHKNTTPGRDPRETVWGEASKQVAVYPALFRIDEYLSTAQVEQQWAEKKIPEWYYCDLNIWSYSDLFCGWKEGSQPLMPFGRLKNRLLVGYYFTNAQHLRFARDRRNCRVNITVVCIRIKDFKEIWVFSYILTQFSKMWRCSKLLSRNVLCLLSVLCAMLWNLFCLREYILHMYLANLKRW